MLDYRYQTFLTVCQTLNYTRAAELLNMTQPAVSQHMAYLEEHLDAKLFLHQNKKVYLTEEGEFLAEKLKFIMNYVDKTVDQLEAIHETKLMIGCTLSISDYLIAPFLIALYKKEKGIRLNVITENTETLLRKLREGKIDAAFIEGDFNQEVFTSVPYHQAQIIGICAPDFELADQKIKLNQLFKEHLIMREKGSGTRSSVENALKEVQVNIESFSNQTKLGSIDLIKQMVAENIGISFLFDICVVDELASGRLKKMEIEEEFSMKNLHFVYLTENPTTEMILKMIK